MKMRSGAGVLSALALGAVAAALVVNVACSGPTGFVYTAREYVEGRDCLFSPVALDVLSGKEPASTCNVCLVTPAVAVVADAAAPDAAPPKAFVSTLCPPLPVDFALKDATDALCARALAAKERSDVCLEDGGTSNPAPRDAGVPIDAAR
jgi:hypothetical protein